MEYVQTYFMALAALFLGFFSGIFGSSDQQAITETTTYHSPNRVQYPSASTKDPATSYKVSLLARGCKSGKKTLSLDKFLTLLIWSPAD